jgi:hypothetical protein
VTLLIMGAEVSNIRSPSATLTSNIYAGYHTRGSETEIEREGDRGRGRETDIDRDRQGLRPRLRE